MAQLGDDEDEDESSASTDPRDILKQKLTEELQRRQRMSSPEMLDRQSQNYGNFATQRDLNNLGELFSAAAAGAGSIGGKTAAPLKGFADKLNASNQDYLQNQRQDQLSRENDFDKKSKLYEYLATQAQKQEDKSNDLAYRDKSLQQARDLANISDTRARDLARETDSRAAARDKANFDRAMAVEQLKGQNALSKDKEPSATQFQAAGFAKRLEQAEGVFDDLTAQGFDRSKQGLQSYLPGLLQSSELKQQKQAERNFVNAVLRRESGAAISQSEFDSAEQQYFPRAGDTAQVLAQKKANRVQKLEELKAEGAKAYDKIPTVKVPKIDEGDSDTAYAGTKGPKKGDREGGYIFQGGDPADRNNWEKE